MKNTNISAEFTTDILRRLALMQHLGEDYFILEIEDEEAVIYKGTEEDAKAGFLADIEGTEEAEIDANFSIYCSNNLEQVEELTDRDFYEEDYYVLTDEEADEKAKEYILKSVWAFTPSFLSVETGIPEEMFVALQDNGKCESNNDAILRCIDDEDSFVDAAISADGRGHFLSSYDGEENEETVYLPNSDTLQNNTTFYIYRIN